MKQIDSLKKDMAGLAEILNAFKSESVQLKVLDYILETRSDEDGASNKAEVKKVKHSRKGTRAKSPRKSDEGGKTGRAAKKSRPSVANTLEHLLQEGFFNKKRTIAEIISYAGSKLGYHYKPNELSTPLVRFVRDKKLDRDKNAENQFEYVKR